MEVLREEFERFKIDIDLKGVDAQSNIQPQNEMFDGPPKPDSEAILKRLGK